MVIMRLKVDNSFWIVVVIAIVIMRLKVVDSCWIVVAIAIVMQTFDQINSTIGSTLQLVPHSLRMYMHRANDTHIMVQTVYMKFIAHARPLMICLCAIARTDPQGLKKALR